MKKIMLTLVLLFVTIGVATETLAAQDSLIGDYVDRGMPGEYSNDLDATPYDGITLAAFVDDNGDGNAQLNEYLTSWLGWCYHISSDYYFEFRTDVNTGEYYFQAIPGTWECGFFANYDYDDYWYTENWFEFESGVFDNWRYLVQIEELPYLDPNTLPWHLYLPLSIGG